jgi:glycogen synthase
MLTFEYGPLRNGGLATAVDALAGALDLRRFEPVIVLPRSGQTPPWELAERWDAPHCQVEIYRDRGREIWLLANERLDGDAIYPEPAPYACIKKFDDYGERVAELLPRMDIDLIHMQDVFGYKCVHAARQLGKPVILTIHRLHDDEPHSACAEHTAVRLADRVTTVSHAYLAENAGYFAAARDVRVIPNGVDLARFRPPAGEGAALGRPARRRRLLDRLELAPRPTFAFIGRLDGEQKGVDVLLEAWPRALREADMNLLVVGEGEAEVLRQVEAAVAAGPADRIRFIHRHCALEEVRDLLGAIDFVVIPSRYEPFGLIQLEAMAMGAVPIASRTGGLAEVMVEMESPAGFGRLFPPGDAPALARAMADLARIAAAEPERMDQLREAGAARVLMHSSTVMAGRYEALYREALSPRPRLDRGARNGAPIAAEGGCHER